MTWRMLFVVGGLLTALPAAAQLTQERATVSAGGGTLTSPQYIVTGTLGQASPVGVLSNATLTIQAGFWHGQSFFLTIVIQGDGSGSVKTANTEVNGGQATIAGATLTIGLFGIEKKFAITQPPTEVEGRWILVLDNIEYVRESP